MEKIKNILSPGKPVDDDILYQANRGENATAHSSMNENDTGMLKGSSERSAQDTPAEPNSALPASTSDAHSENPTAEASSTLVHDDNASVTTANTLRPEYPTPASAGSTASIKSNIIGRVPTGSAVGQQSGDLPSVPATDGKFMNTEDLPIPPPESTTNQAFPLAGQASTLTSAGDDGPHQTATANRLDPNFNPKTSMQSSHSQPVEISDVREGGVEQRAPTVSQKDPDLKLSMPGAYPETPALESDKTLGQNEMTGAVGSGAAVIAARKAYEQHDSKQTSARPEATHPVEATPYSSTLDARVNAAKKQDINRSVATGASSGISATPAGVANAEQPVTHQSSLSEKIHQANASEKDHHDRDFALAGATAAGGAASGLATEASHDIDKQAEMPVPQGSFGEKLQDVQNKDDDLGRNVAVAGATTAVAGIGAHEAADRIEQPALQQPPVLQQPAASSSAHDYAGTSATTYTSEAATASTLGPDRKEREFPLIGKDQVERGVFAGSATDFSSTKPVEHRTVTKDAAETGAAGAAGLVAYEALEHREGSSTVAPARDNADPLASSAHPAALQGYDDQRALPVYGGHSTNQETSHRTDHGAALVGAGAGATGVAAHQAEHRPETIISSEHENAKSEGTVANKDEGRHRKSEDRHRASEDKEHKHGLLHRILHPHKSKEGVDKDNEPASPTGKSRSSSDRAFDRTSLDRTGEQSPTSDDMGTPDSAKHALGRNRLHKDPPPGYHAK